MRSYLGIGALLCFVLGACAPGAEEPEQAAEATAGADMEAINALRQEYVAAYNASSVERLIITMTDDVVLMPPNEPGVTGHEAVSSRYAAIFEQFTAELTVSSEELEVLGNRAFDRGTFTITLTSKAGGEPTEDNGKYIVILQKQPYGSWQIARHIWNSSNPFPASSGAAPST